MDFILEVDKGLGIEREREREREREISQDTCIINTSV